MPAQKLSEDPALVRRFDVLATASENDPDLPTHLMLCNESADRADVKKGTKLEIAHMGPPLGEKSGKHADAVGSVELTESEKKQIELFVKERLAESKELRKAAKSGGPAWTIATQYRIFPSSTPPSADCSYWRFSCVGFVLSAYNEAAISVLAESCPLKSLEDIKALYNHPQLADPDFRTEMGIGNGDEWPIAMAGYVLNAMNRESGEIRETNTLPHQPVNGEEYFPHRSNEI